MDAVDRTHVDARHVLDVDARLRDDVAHRRSRALPGAWAPRLATEPSMAPLPTVGGIRRVVTINMLEAIYITRDRAESTVRGESPCGRGRHGAACSAASRLSRPVSRAAGGCSVSPWSAAARSKSRMWVHSPS
jgi:hypothetical protein